MPTAKYSYRAPAQKNRLSLSFMFFTHAWFMPPPSERSCSPFKSTPATGLAIALMNEKKDLRMFVIQLHSTKNWSSAFWDSYAFGSYYFVIRSIRSRFAFLGRNLIHIRKDGEIRQV